MTYEQTLEYLFTQLPVYQRQGAAAYKPDLSKTEALMDLLGHPERGLKCIHIAGTNGKGSVSSLVASVLQHQGYKVGLYTSPHLKDFRERIRIGGQKVPHDWVVDFVATHKEDWKDLQPSFFEITVGMAFRYFRDEQVDIAVLETGLGGRLDSTNVVLPEVSVITNIGLDHTPFLGETIPLIAREKGGIIKPNTPVVLGPMLTEAQEVLVTMASVQNAAVTDAGAIEDQLPESDLIGSYQKDNKKTAMAALKVLKGRGWDLGFEAVVNGFATAAKTTGLLGRWQRLGSEPTIIADCAHNPDGIRQAMAQLDGYRYAGLHIVVGVVGDKNPERLLRELPRSANYYFTRADIPRAMDPEELAEAAAYHGLRGETYDTVKSAYAAARLYAEKDDLIFVGGSIFVVAEVV